MSKTQTIPGQLGFDALLASAESENAGRKLARRTAHLPGTMDEAVPYFRALIERHHAAMLAADVDTVLALREEADDLALKLNHGKPGILADENAPGRVLDSATAAEPGTVPLWGQSGRFRITTCGTEVRIELDGIFGVGSGICYWPGFEAHAVDPHAPFISSTGYRSFLGLQAEPVPGLTPDTFAAMAITAHVGRSKNGLVRIEEQYRKYCDPLA